MIPGSCAYISKGIQGNKRDWKISSLASKLSQNVTESAIPRTIVNAAVRLMFSALYSHVGYRTRLLTDRQLVKNRHFTNCPQSKAFSQWLLL